SGDAYGNGLDRPVVALATGNGGVYVGGLEGPFRAYNSLTDTVSIESIAFWQGTGQWTALANSASLGANPDGSHGVRALAVDGEGNLYVAGSFTAIGNLSVNRIARWDGTTWSRLGADGGDAGNGLDDTVYALAFASNGDLYAGGAFRNAYSASGNSIAANHIARWNGSDWAALGTGGGSTGNGLNAPVWALAISSSDVVAAGGQFSLAFNGSDPQVSANRVALWDGANWTPLGTDSGGSGNGVNNNVRALAWLNTTLYAGGDFTTAYNSNSSSLSVGRIASWDGASWSGLGSGLNNRVNALLLQENHLYVGGSFTTAGGQTASRLARWDGTGWAVLGAGTSATGNGVNGIVDSLALSEDGLALLVGGAFSQAFDDDGNSSPAANLASWEINGHSWSALAGGLDGEVRALAATGSDIWTGGLFTRADGAPSTYVGRWQVAAQLADLALAKSASAATVEIGETVAYTLTVSNAGPISGTMTVLTDTLSLAASMITMPVASQGSCSATQMPLWVIECDLGDVAVGQTITISYAVAPAASGTLVNTALTASTTADPNVSNNGAQVMVTVNDPVTPTHTPTHTPTPTATPAPSNLTLGRSALSSGGGVASGGGLQVNSTLGQSSPLGGTGTDTRTLASGYWGATLPISRLWVGPAGGGTINWSQVELTFPPQAGDATVWLIPQLGAVSGLGNDETSVGISFHVEVYAEDGTPITSFSEPYAVLVRYEESQWQNAGIVDEQSLTLVYRDETSGTW
ncbi:MAG: DUF11 domain-containing protein, partial [Anaerolineales bacterium]|nr:DUF11 domain-containing protein [Anaerolineales bacterium]